MSTKEEIYEEEEEGYGDENDPPQDRFNTRCRFQDEEAAIEIWNQFQAEIDPCKPDEFGSTPLHAIAANGMVELLTEVLKKPGINVNVKTLSDNTPLHFAAINGNNKIIKILLAAGADTKIKNKQGQTAYFEAASRFADGSGKQEVETVDMLLGPDSEIPKDIEAEVEKGDLDGL
ncbi:ankyrin repeat protein, putative [Trichomonas vaginalis G3]|uniref:Ankyrin repeat protein, putative n=1 Tax=Trichomonas vaginalis (strain ATCC PRA-98 / G3) TaxID=412133 RepID=A2EUF4_TRIV3|nr:protein ubiquitination [Trichomonas vaginalis G3]EAY03713.1 ankyrin repeat protein, putative [Trichomonas vaginalis G3]KAI5529023.1 protein ubiquitination [Trichomonas vaginalis G3]|eukprot:XP_001315936.1 ankyrin repeat protein [Trichomonas vaginalis G3]